MRNTVFQNTSGTHPFYFPQVIVKVPKAVMSPAPVKDTGMPVSQAGSRELIEHVGYQMYSKVSLNQGCEQGGLVILLRCISQGMISALFIIKLKHDTTSVPGKFLSVPT